jgi:glucose/arabinose dehydrogenase
MRRLIAAALLCACGNPPAHLPADVACTPGPGTALALHEVASGLTDPLLVTAPPGDHRLFIVERPGRIRIVRDGALREQPFLAIEDLVEDLGLEQGLLGLAFHPGYADNGRLFVYYTRQSDAYQVLAEYRVSPDDGDRADPDSAQLLLELEDPASNHNGGMLAFGPRDGLLYVSTGDGGGRNDEYGNGQNLDSPWGKLLRLDVDAAAPQPEIWAWGLRNPWRFSFDRATGDLYIGDVGQKAYEEIDVVPADSPGGTNFGWSTMEGIICFFTGGCDMTGLTLPVFAYPHSGAVCSVTGGYVYRGACIPDLAGRYFFSDWCSNQIWTLEWPGAVEPVDRTAEIAGAGQLDGVSSFGESATGELYVTSLNDGRVYRLVRAEN